MRRRLLTRAVLLFLTIAIGTAPSSAIDNHELMGIWELTPDSTIRHPKNHHLTVVAPEQMDVALCDIGYLHLRSNNSGSDFPPLPSGGKIKATLHLVNSDGTRKIAKATAKVEFRFPDFFGERTAALGWADSAGDFWETEFFEYKRNKNFPVHLEPGDMLRGKIQFKGVPRLESEKDADPWYQDRIHVAVSCHSCGSFTTPCPNEY